MDITGWQPSILSERASVCINILLLAWQQQAPVLLLLQQKNR
jgi:hypothetical protein